MSKTSCFIFHDWEKWEQYTWKGMKAYQSNVFSPLEYYPCTEYRQKRVCKRCGYTQIRRVEEN